MIETNHKTFQILDLSKEITRNQITGEAAEFQLSYQTNYTLPAPSEDLTSSAADLVDFKEPGIESSNGTFNSSFIKLTINFINSISMKCATENRQQLLQPAFLRIYDSFASPLKSRCIKTISEGKKIRITR